MNEFALPERDPVVVLGRFPPPVDGQSMATDRLASLLESGGRVVRIDTEPGDGVTAEDTRLRLGRIAHFMRLKGHIRRELAQTPSAPVLWASISPTLLGHFRDARTMLPAIDPTHPLVAISHRATLNSMFESRWTKGSALRMVERVDRFVFLTQAISDRCADWIPPEKRVVIPNTIDADMLCTGAELRAKTGPGEPFRLLFLSNMMVEKGYEDVLDATAELGDSVHTTFAGAWPSKEAELAFRTRAASKHLTHRVRMMGPISDRSKVKELYMKADAFVLPSWHPTEGMPLTVLEALGTGTPVIVTRHGGMADMIEEGRSGLFVPPRDSGAITGAVKRLMNASFWADLSRGARSRFMDRYHPDAVRQQWKDLLDGFTKPL